MASRQRHVPERTCVGCRQKAPKRELIRIVRTPDGEVRLDADGRAPGRGCYLHNTSECWEIALRRGTIEHALKIKTIPKAGLENLRPAGIPLTTGGIQRHAHDSKEGNATGEHRDPSGE